MKKTRFCLVACALLLMVQMLPAQVQRFAWGNVAIGGGGFVSAIIADPNAQNLFYARTDVGGAYRWDNALSKWVSIMDWVDVNERGLLGVEAIAVDPKTPGKVYMVAGTSYWNDGRSAFLRSSNKGQSFDVIELTQFGAHGNGMGRGNGEALAIDPNNSNIMFYGSRDKGLFKSTNNGTNWSKVNSFTTAAGSDTTFNGAGFSFVTFSPGNSNILYAGFLRANNNVFRSTDGGSTWSVIPNRPQPATRGGYKPPLMPQRIAIAANGSALYITFGDGAGPHTMQWDGVNDWFNRGAVLKYETAGNGTWTDVSPENFIDPGDKNYDDASEYVACYGGISINPSNPLELVVSSIGYRGPQFWKLPGNGNLWTDQWGSNIYYTKDGGKNWYPSFKYFWIESGFYPDVQQMSENGIGWMFNSSIHWSGSVAFDPFNPKRVWVTSGNGMFATDNITDFTYTPPENSWDEPTLEQRTVWKVMSHGIEETVPIEVISIPKGPLVSVILDYDGFRHDDITKYPATRHITDVGGTKTALGNTIALAYAPKSGRLVKVSEKRVYEGQYSDIAYWPVQFSNDSGRTWSVTAHQSNATTNLPGAEGVSISADGEVVLWTPNADWGNNPLPVQRLVGASSWSTVSGIDGSYTVGDPENESVFYAYNRWSGKFFKSTDKGATFSEASTPGESDFKKFRLVPGKEGDIWIPLTNGGLTRSTNGGSTFGKIASVSYCEAVGFGKAAPEKSFPTVFIFGTVGGITGVFMSIDEGANWVRANDDKHEYGGLANGEFVVGDMNVYSRVYMSTAGRGIVYGEITEAPEDPGTGIRLQQIANIQAFPILGGVNLQTTSNTAVEVYDLNGRGVLRNTFASGVHNISLSHLPKGMYIFTATPLQSRVERKMLRIVVK